MSPPALLRSIPEQNYLDRGVRIFGLTLCGIALFATLGSAVWVFLYRHHNVVIAAQASQPANLKGIIGTDVRLC